MLKAPGSSGSLFSHWLMGVPMCRKSIRLCCLSYSLGKVDTSHSDFHIGVIREFVIWDFKRSRKPSPPKSKKKKWIRKENGRRKYPQSMLGHNCLSSSKLAEVSFFNALFRSHVRSSHKLVTWSLWHTSKMKDRLFLRLKLQSRSINLMCTLRTTNHWSWFWSSVFFLGFANCFLLELRTRLISSPDGLVYEGPLLPSLIPRSHIVEGEKWLPKAIFWPPHVCHAMLTSIYTHVIKNKAYLEKQF